MAAPEQRQGHGIDRDAVEHLTRAFRAGSRGPIRRRILTGGMVDMNKVMALLDEFDLPYDRFDLIEPRAAASDLSWTPSHPAQAPAPPPGAAHYIFNPAPAKRPGLLACRFQDAYLSFDVTDLARREFYLFDRNKNLINGFFFGAQPFLDPEMAVVGTPSVFIDDFYVTPNICHFLFDKMPRVAIAEPEFGKREALLFREFQYARDVLDLLGTNMTALAATKARGTVRLRDVVVYSSSFAQIGHPAMLGGAGHLAALDALRTRILDLAKLSKSRMPRRFMLNRAPGLPRNITNRDEVLAVMARHDVLVGDPTILPARKQLVLFANVDLLIGVHGAGLTNLAYQPKGARVVELLPPLCATRAYWIMAGGLGQRYDAITCHDPERGAVDSTKLKHDVSLNRRDVVVPIDALEATLSA